MSDPRVTTCLVEYQQNFFNSSAIHNHLPNHTFLTTTPSGAVEFIRGHGEVDIVVVPQYPGYAKLIQALAEEEILIVASVRDVFSKEPAVEAGAYACCVGTGSELATLLRTVGLQCCSTTP